MSFHLWHARKLEAERRASLVQEPKLIWESRYKGRYDARVQDYGADWKLTVTDSQTGATVHEVRASQPYSTLKIFECARDWYEPEVERAVHRYEMWDTSHRDSDGTRSAETACPAPVPQDCQARAESIAQPSAGDQ